MNLIDNKSLFIALSLLVNVLPVTSRAGISLGNMMAVPHAADEVSEPACTDFSGSWDGVCRIENSSHPDQKFNMVVQQSGCSQLTLGELFPIQIGGLTSHSTSKKDNSQNFSVSSDWDNRRKELSARVVFAFRSNHEDHGFNGTGTQNLQLKIENDQLLLDIASIFDMTGSGNPKPEKVRIICTLNRK